VTLAAETLQACRVNGWKIATAESCTGGMVAAALTDIAGSSDVFDRGFVTYSNQAKVDMLDVDPAIIDKFGAVSAQVAEQMALGALQNSTADIAVAVTGVAGPGGSDNKPEGLVWFCLAYKSGRTIRKKAEFGAIGRANVRSESTILALEMLLNA